MSVGGRLAFVVIAFDEHGATAGALAGLDVAPAIAHHEAAREVVDRRRSQQTRLGLPAVARIRIVVIADANFIERQAPAQFAVDGVDRRPGLRSPSDIRLVGDDDQSEPGVSQPPQGGSGFGVDGQLVDAGGRIRFAGPHDGFVEDTISIQKHRRRSYLSDSHLVAATFSAGCDTSRCHTTA